MEDSDAETTSLLRWLSFYAVNAEEECVSVVLRLLTLAFPVVDEDLKALDGWRAVLATLEGFYETELTVDVQKLEGASAELNDTLKAVLELVLGAVVQCEAKEKFIKDILTMEDAVQGDLMMIIEKVMAKETAILSERRVQAGVVQSEEQKESLGLSSPLYLSRNAALERVKRENGVLKEENIHLARELEEMTKKFYDVENEKMKLVEMMQQLNEQVDTDVLRKERAMHAQYDERIQTLQLELDSTTANLRDKSVQASQVPALRDELDLLRPLAEKLKKMDSTVAKYKAKIDELSGAKDQLRLLEGANAELQKKNFALESDLAKAASWQRKLKEAKAANTAVEFRISELETLLTRERQELAATRAELESVQGALQESKILNAQLQESTSHQMTVDEAENNNSSSTPTMSGGISEFNPELMQKIIRLEYENVELKRKIDSETGARIDSLLDEIDDLTRLKKLFEKKYFDTQQTLQSAQSDFKQTKQQFESTVAEFQERNRELSDWQTCLEEDIAAHALEKQFVVVQRDRLSTELCASKEGENRLTQAVSNRDRELLIMKEATEVIVCENEQLVGQCALLSRAKEGVEANLARQIEWVAMQEEDATAERIRFQEQKARELNQVYVQYEVEAARMTVLLDAKFTEIEQLTSKMQEDKVDNDAKQQKMEAAHMSTTKELERYQELYSISNSDWRAKEDELNNRVKELESLCSQCKQQEQTLKSTIKSQLQSNAQLVEKNKAMKANAIESRETITMLEHMITRLESKVTVFEMERSHFTIQEERKRDAEDGISSYSSQLSTQASLVAAELEKVLKENKELYAKQAGCQCGHESPPRGGISDSGQKAKAYYLTRIQQLENDKQQVEHKRRELLLVNAKLIQEQKQLKVKNVSLSSDVRELEESVNHWRLRDERRRKKEGQPSLPLESNLSLSPPGAKKAPPIPKNQPSSNDLPSQEHPFQKTTSKLPVSKNKKTVSRDGSVSAFTSASTSKKFSSIKATATSRTNRKRKLKSDYTTSESVQPKSTQADSSSADSGFTNAKTFFSKPSGGPAQSSEPRSKRRFSHFITRNLVPDKTIPQNDKPSDCKQQ